MNVARRIAAGALLALAFAVGSARAEPQAGAVRLEDGSELRWTLSDQTPAPALGIALPSYATLTGGALEGPIHIDLSTNYAAFIDRWELALYRESDTYRRHPVRLWRSSGVSLDAGIEWDGSVANGPPLRPGETIVGVFRVRDVAGNVDESQPQTMLVSRYLMPIQKRKLDRKTRARRRSVAAGDPPAVQTIPLTGGLFEARISDPVSETAMRVAGVAMDRDGSTGWRLSQVLPAGTFTLKVQTERAIIGGLRLISVGRLPIAVPRGEDHFATVKGTGDLKRGTLDQSARGLTPDGAISGRDAVRLALWQPNDPEGRATLALVDPKIPTGLYRDNRGRSVLRVRSASRDVPWGTETKPRKPSKPIKMRAQYPAREHTAFFLPHTDIETEKFFFSVRSDTQPPSYLRPAAHFDLEPSQGRVRLTKAGRQTVDTLIESAGNGAVIEMAYMVRPSLAGLGTERPDNGMFRYSDNGASRAMMFETSAAMGPQAGGAASEQPGWFARNLGWLIGG